MKEIPLNIKRELSLHWNENQLRGFLRVNRLYFDNEKSKWRCDWSIDHLYPKAVHFAGDDPMDALTRTLDFASSFIRGSTIDGIGIQWQYPGDRGGLEFPQSESGSWRTAPSRPEVEGPHGASQKDIGAFQARTIAPIISVSDLASALKEYQGYGFGTPKVFGQPPVHAKFEKNGIELHLSAQGKCGCSSVWIVVDNLDKVKKVILESRPNLNYEELENPPSGFREFSIEDLSGNVLTFAQER